MALIDTYRSNVIRKREAISKLVSDKAKESDKIAKARAKIDSANQAKASLMLEGISEETTPELFVREGLQAENIILVQP